MAQFDERAYRDRVLKPLRSVKGPLPGDLEVRYAVTTDLDDAAIAVRVKAVVGVWNKQALVSGPMGTVATRLLDEHTRLKASDGDPGTAAFWRTYRARRAATVGPAIAEVAEDLRHQFGPLGVLTETQLRAAAAARPELGDGDVAAACEQAGLRVVEPVELPDGGPVRGRAGTLTEALAGAQIPGVAQLLAPDLGTVSLLGGLTVTVPGGRPRTLGPDDVRRRSEELEALADGSAVRLQKDAAGFLSSELRAGADLTRMALFHLLDAPRTQRAAGAAPPVLFRMLTAAGVEPSEAALLAVSVSAESAAPVRDPAATARSLLAEGLLVAAEQAAAAVPGAEGDTVRAEMAAARARVEALRQQAADELRAGREEKAGGLLRQALGLASDLPGLAEELRGIPAAPVLAASAAPSGLGVRVSWRPAPDHADDTEFRVLRGDRRAPADPDDGTVLTTGGAGSVTDPVVPVAVLLHYAVFARVPGGRWSRPCPATIRVVPPVGDLRVSAGDGSVTGSFAAHPDASEIEVTRSTVDASGAADSRIPVRNRSSFRDTSVVEGVRYRYTVVACYRGLDGALLRSDPVEGRGGARVAVQPVSSLTVGAPAPGTTGVRLSWRARGGGEVVVRRAETPCPWAFGETVAETAVSGWGQELVGERTERAGATVLDTAVPAGRSYCAAFTVGNGELIRGGDAQLDLVEPVGRLQAHRFGDDVRLSWLWPDGAVAADVGWSGGGRRISTTAYRSEGGCLVRGVPTVRRFAVAAVVLAGGDESRAPAAEVEVVDRPRRLSYELTRRGSRLFGGVRATVVLTTDSPGNPVTVVLVGAGGRVMPTTPAGGIELLRRRVELRPGEPVVLPDIALPASLRKPFWLRLFLDPGEGAVLVDPPVHRLKVS